MNIITEGQTGFGFLIEHDAGYINPRYEKNQPILTEGKDYNKFLEKPILHCVLQRYDVPNMNKRIYPKDILMNAVEEYKNGFITMNGESPNVVASMGEVDHENETSVALKNTGLVIRDCYWEGNALMGVIELIISRGFKEMGIVSAPGDLIANLIVNDVLVGISSRSIGSVEKGEDEHNIVQDDLKIICWDAVSVPSTPLANFYINKKDADAKINYKPPVQKTVKKQDKKSGQPFLYDKRKANKLDKLERMSRYF